MQPPSLIPASQYDRLLHEFIQYQETIFTFKQQKSIQFTKSHTEAQELYARITKKYEQKLNEENAHQLKKEKKAEEKCSKMKKQFSIAIKKKNKKIQELIEKLSAVQRQKNQIIQDHTTMLCEIVKENEESEVISGPSKTAYTELTKLYQYVLEENNSLKKEKRRNEMVISEKLAKSRKKVKKDSTVQNTSMKSQKKRSIHKK